MSQLKCPSLKYCSHEDLLEQWFIAMFSFSVDAKLIPKWETVYIIEALKAVSNYLSLSLS